MCSSIARSLSPMLLPQLGASMPTFARLDLPSAAKAQVQILYDRVNEATRAETRRSIFWL
jgi:hypothetical protein